MFIHIGNNNVIRSREIVIIVDYSVITSSLIMENMVGRAEIENKVVKAKSEAKSIVITNDLIYFSSLSVPTLKKRSGISSIINKLENHSNVD